MSQSPPRPRPRITAIATAVPESDVHASYTEWAASQLPDERKAALFRRMEARGGISHRYSVLTGSDAAMDFGSFYMNGAEPGTGERMKRYAAAAPDLAMKAIEGLPSTDGITHIVIASCTGFMAPGLDQLIARRLGLSSGVERVSIGFMGCYAGITLLRTAAHIVRSDPTARVLAVSVELCSLHLQETGDIESLLAMGQFADGASAVLVSGEGEGLGLGEGLSLALEESDDLITWTIGDSGFAMHLSGEVPARLAEALDSSDVQKALLGEGHPLSWAVHPGGKSVLDAVERGLSLEKDALAASRCVLDEFGNMSSATVLFVLEKLAQERPANGIALAFGPGLAMEGLRYGWIKADAD
ncbi:type III polyketide synthase [Aurantiacibacter poecillastricola]|uniref:type III polyketide synthase n=1 Tax=Aurantiacibacter poecillastricola TaxID=3064385 RepID=UPI00273D7A3C|nr:type III polyketide synthase [Aurantiacibacter sp. 219JJ12-13]MDP5261713.1 type III polyketide synthase [Aurantiacibacter sp. 219JJ12-13]